MKPLTFLTPYLLKRDTYRHFYIKPHIVYLTNENDGAYEVSIYNTTHTKILNRLSWISPYEVEEYTPDRLRKLQEEFEEEGYDDDLEEDEE